ncbi:hypothetical protein CEXT_493301 [Caerostris extrusa]|uniref:Uncharacterized protein n=1 Tax=Caerostris extrusa TaxID=172846 RepID=A0AAV4XSR5_CAEEX|nr:hypothetical protein CEXT_493301 [Caerostris extrusa]
MLKCRDKTEKRFLLLSDRSEDCLPQTSTPKGKPASPSPLSLPEWTRPPSLLLLPPSNRFSVWLQRIELKVKQNEML